MPALADRSSRATGWRRWDILYFAAFVRRTDAAPADWRARGERRSGSPYGLASATPAAASPRGVTFRPAPRGQISSGLDTETGFQAERVTLSYATTSTTPPDARVAAEGVSPRSPPR